MLEKGINANISVMVRRVPCFDRLPRTLVSLLDVPAMSELLIILSCEVLVKALRAPQHLQYQLAFLSSVSLQGGEQMGVHC